MNPRSNRPQHSQPTWPLWIAIGIGLLAVCGIGIWYTQNASPIQIKEGETVSEATIQAIVNRLEEEVPFSSQSLLEHRKNHRTKLQRLDPSPQEAPDNLESSRLGQWLNFESDGRLLFGCLRLPKGTGPHPAVVYCHGGFALGDSDIQAIDPLVDQGFAVFVPAWRGENGNAGSLELYYGEADDAVAAMEFLARLPHVEENAIYLAGHSAGATTALLAAELSDRPQAVMACGPVLDMTRLVEVAGEQTFEEAPFAIREQQETNSRSPGRFLNNLNCPAQLVYGDDELILIAQAESVSGQVRKQGLDVSTKVIPETDHFSVLPAAIQSAAAFFLKHTKTRPTPVVRKADFFGACKDLILGPQPVPSPTDTAHIASNVERWSSKPNDGEPLLDWSGFTRWYNKDPYKVPRKPSFRAYPTNGRWVTSESFENDFVIASLDGSKLHKITGAIPNLLSGAAYSRYEPAGVSLDGQQFAVVWSGKVATEDPVRWWITIHQSSDGKLLHSVEDTHACQFLPGARALLIRQLSADPKKNTGQSATVMAIETGDVSTEIQLGPDDRISVSPDGDNLVVLRSVGNDASLEVHSIDSGQMLSKGTYKNVPVGLNVAVSLDGKEAFTVGQRRATVWDLETGKIVFSRRVSDVHRVAGWLEGRRFLLLDQYKVLDRKTGNRVATMAHRVTSTNEFSQHGPWLGVRDIRPGRPPRRMPVESIQKLRESMPPQPVLNRPMNIYISFQYSERSMSEEFQNRGGIHLVRERDGILSGKPQNHDFVNFALCQRIGATFDQDAELQSTVVLKHTSDWSAAPAPTHLQLHGKSLPANIPRAGIMNKPRAKLTLQMTGTLAPPPKAPQVSLTIRQGKMSFIAENFEAVTAESEFTESLPFDVGLPWLEQTQATALTNALTTLKLPSVTEFRLAPANDTWRPMLMATPGTEAAAPEVTTSRFSLDSPFLLEGSQGATYVLHEMLKGDDASVGSLEFVHSGKDVVVLAGLMGPCIREFKLDGESRDLAKMRSGSRVGGFHRDDGGTRWIATAGGIVLIGDDTPGGTAVIAYSEELAIKNPVLTADGKFIVESVGGKRKEPMKLAVWNVDPLLKLRRGDLVELPDPDSLTDRLAAKKYLPIPGSSDLLAIEYKAVHRLNVDSGSIVWRSEFADKAKASLSGEIVDDGKSALILCEANGEYPEVLVDLATGKLTDQPPSTRHMQLRVYSPDQTLFATFDKDQISIYHSEAEEQLWTSKVGSFNGIPGQVNSRNCLVWSPDSRYLAAACNDSQRGTKLSAIDVWDVSEVKAK